jgi:hypothetical protein
VGLGSRCRNWCPKYQIVFDASPTSRYISSPPQCRISQLNISCTVPRLRLALQKVTRAVYNPRKSHPVACKMFRLHLSRRKYPCRKGDVDFISRLRDASDLSLSPPRGQRVIYMSSRALTYSWSSNLFQCLEFQKGINRTR